MTETAPPPLLGEADKAAFHAINANGDPVDLNQAVFPIIAQETDGRLRLIGTGFFIAEQGVFASAN